MHARDRERDERAPRPVPDRVRHANPQLGTAGPPRTRASVIALQKLAGNRALTLSLGVQRQDIPAPPPAFPSVYNWWGWTGEDASLPNLLMSLWGLTCQDRLERGFYVWWNSETNHTVAGETVVGAPWMATERPMISYGPVPRDQPPWYPVGKCHTHPPPYPGYTRDNGPSDIDRRTEGDLAKLPGVVVDFRGSTTTKGDGTFYFYGPSRRVW